MQVGGCFVFWRPLVLRTTDQSERHVPTHHYNFADPNITEMSLSKLVQTVITTLLIAGTEHAEDNAQIQPNHPAILSVQPCTSNSWPSSTP